jgi:hypothetical protein
MEAWTELIYRLFRFGHRNMVAKKSGPEGRVELQNIKAIIERPVEEADEILRAVRIQPAEVSGLPAAHSWIRTSQQILLTRTEIDCEATSQSRFARNRRAAAEGEAGIAPRLYRVVGQRARPAGGNGHALLRVGVL